jgi:hypothetical protein
MQIAKYSFQMGYFLSIPGINGLTAFDRARHEAALLLLIVELYRVCQGPGRNDGAESRPVGEAAPQTKCGDSSPFPFACTLWMADNPAVK